MPARMNAEQSARHIERLRKHRIRPEREIGIGSIVESIDRRTTRVQRQLGALIELWQAELPQEIASRTELTALRGGVLHAKADSSAVAYELDRCLREGLLARLRARFPGPLSRVRVSL